MRYIICRSIALSLAICVYAALARDTESPGGRKWSQKRDVAALNDNITTSNPAINLLSTAKSSDASGKKDNLDGIQVVSSGHNSTSNSTYLVVTNNASVPGGGRRLIEIDTSHQHSFLTAYCDARILGSIESTALEEMLAQVQANLRIVINQAKKGIGSKYGFQALFKSQSNKGQVASIFDKIMTVAVANNDPDQAPIQPLIICAAAEANDMVVEGMHFLYERCQSDPNRRAAQPPNSNIVVLCPSFWEMPGVPPQGSCPEKDAKTGVMMPNEAWLQLNRQATFVHEMIHMYLGRGYGLAKNETYKVGDAVALEEEESMRNPSNYAFFYAGELERPLPVKRTDGLINKKLLLQGVESGLTSQRGRGTMMEDCDAW